MFKVGRFGVRQYPDYQEIIEKLTANPPQDENIAKEIFEYLASLYIYSQNWKSLANIKFIPVRDKANKTKIIHTNPSSSYFINKGRKKMYVF
jgi:hypothetical protein